MRRNAFYVYGGSEISEDLLARFPLMLDSKLYVVKVVGNITIRVYEVYKKAIDAERGGDVVVQKASRTRPTAPCATPRSGSGSEGGT